MAMVQTGYAGFDKGNSVTEILKCSVGELSTQEYTSKPTLLRLNCLQADFSENTKSALVSFLLGFFHHQILLLVAKWERWQSENDDI